MEEKSKERKEEREAADPLDEEIEGESNTGEKMLKATDEIKVLSDEELNDLIDEEEEDDGENENMKTVWVWHSEESETTCDDCETLDGQEFYDEMDLPECPVHSNCKCWIEEKEIDGEGNTASSRPYENKSKKRLPKNMKLSEKGMDFLIRKEGRVIVDGKHVIYDDKDGKPVPEDQPLPKGATIGYGHLIKEGEEERFRKGLTEQEAQDLRDQDIQAAEKIVQKFISAPVSQNQYDALASLAFNIGPKGLKDSTIRKYINNPEFQSDTYPTPEDAWKAWNKTTVKKGDFIITEINDGLVKRRDSDWNLYKNGTY